MQAAEEGWQIVEALATCIVALGTILIPIFIDRHGSRLEAQRELAAKEDERLRNNSFAEHQARTAKREVMEQWQSYNLAVAGGSIGSEALSDRDFDGLDPDQIKQLHVIFFKLTLLHQLWVALDGSVFEDKQAQALINQIGPTCRENPRLYAIATNNRGYSREFLAVIDKCTRER